MLPVSASLFHPLTDSFIVFTSRVHWRAWWWISTITEQGYSPSPLIGNPRTVARMINVWSWPKALGELSFACLSSDIYSYSVAFSYKKVSWILRCTRNILSGGKPSLLIKSEYLYKVQWIRDDPRFTSKVHHLDCCHVEVQLQVYIVDCLICQLSEDESARKVADLIKFVPGSQETWQGQV